MTAPPPAPNTTTHRGRPPASEHLRVVRIDPQRTRIERRKGPVPARLRTYTVERWRGAQRLGPVVPCPTFNRAKDAAAWAVEAHPNTPIRYYKPAAPRVPKPAAPRVPYATIERIDKRAPRTGYHGGYVAIIHKQGEAPHQLPYTFKYAAQALALLTALHPDMAVKGYKTQARAQATAPRVDTVE